MAKSQLDRLRLAEKELNSQLVKLRKQIAVAERGQNKRIKDANKYIQRTNKTLARFTREQEALREKELSRLERFLGETFESVGEAREAFAKQTRKATQKERIGFLRTEAQKARESAARSKTQKQKERKLKQAAALERELEGRKLDPNKPRYKIRQLSELERQSVIDFLTDKKTFNEAGMGYLGENERITVSVPYLYYDPATSRVKQGRALGRKIFRDWKSFQAYLISYMGQDSTEEWLGDIEIIKFPDEYNYRVDRGRQTDVINKRRKDVKELNRGRIKKAKKQARESERKKQQKKIESQKRKIEKLKGRK